jgi:hypothetical protein
MKEEYQCLQYMGISLFICNWKIIKKNVVLSSNMLIMDPYIISKLDWR